MIPESSHHPVDLLEAFALNALEPLEEETVQDHLDGCHSCSEVVETYQQTAVSLAEVIGLVAAPGALRSRVLNSLPALQPEPVVSDPIMAGPIMAGPAMSAPGPSLFTRFLETRFARLLMPATAAIAIVLVIVAVSMNVSLANRVSEMEKENLALRIVMDSSNATTTAHFSEMADAGVETTSGIQQLREASYAAAQPDNLSLLLRPTRDDSPSQGILMLAADGRAAILVVTGMNPEMTAGYQVWLERGGERELAGTVNVDSAGWGTVKLNHHEPLSSFDTVKLTDPNDMVLEASLASAALPQRMVSLPIGR